MKRISLLHLLLLSIPNHIQAVASDYYYCGTSWNDAKANCWSHCPSGQDNECPEGMACFGDTGCTSANSSPSPSPSDHYFCGSDWSDADANCHKHCPGGEDSECDFGSCFADTQCTAGPSSPTTPSPTTWTTPSPSPAPTPVPATPTAPSPPSSGSGEDSRLVAFLGNWQPCPSLSAMSHYTHIMIAFAVTYTWNPTKNVCSADCTIGSPVPVCDNAPNPALVSAWKAEGKKVILSFGGAGMGGSWEGDPNDCWEYCYGKEQSVITQLDTIVRSQGFDGVDIDYEYFYNSQASRDFLRGVTTGLRSALPAGSIVTHTPMDADLVKGTAYYDILKDVSSSLDMIMPQYYNGVTRPAADGIDGTDSGSMSALSHYDDLVNDMFGGRADKVVFGFCISDCSGTGSNADGTQAATIMSDLRTYYPCNGGAFFWEAAHDFDRNWSTPVSDEMQPYRGCVAGPITPSPTAITPSPTSPPPTPSPTQCTKKTTGESCSSDSDCCSGACSIGKPSSRYCLPVE